MKIVIDIPKEIYDALYVDYVFNPPVRNGKTLFFILHKCIANGKPLPEHHGRLVDANALEKKMTEYINTLPLTYDEAERIVLLMNHFDDAPTIIEGE